MIETKNITKAYGAQQVLQGVNLQLARSEIVCLMAPSGAGKTTLARILMGLEAADSGSIQPQGLRFSAVFQENRLLPQCNAAANVRFVCGAACEQELHAAFAAVGLEPEDLQKPSAQLSGGQKRRVALVRAMLAKSDCVVLDEPFKGLDEAVHEAAAQFVRKHQNGRAVLVITHEEADAQMLNARIAALRSE